MTGKLREAGAGDGEGYTINIPIPGTLSLEKCFWLLSCAEFGCSCCEL